jgi:hypothetical protein
MQLTQGVLEVVYSTVEGVHDVPTTSIHKWTRKAG